MNERFRARANGGVRVVHGQRPNGEHGVGLEILDNEGKIEAWAWMTTNVARDVADQIRTMATNADAAKTPEQKETDRARAWRLLTDGGFLKKVRLSTYHGVMLRRCECEFSTDVGDPDDDWHFDRTCLSCGAKWRGVHCPHDGVQNPCPSCGAVPVPAAEK